MWALTSAFIDIALHRRSPQDLPASQPLFRLALIAYGIVLFATLAIVPTTRSQLMLIVVGPAVDLAALFLLLKLVGKPGRFLQTAIAMFGVAVLLNALALPVLYWDEALGAAPEQMTAPRFVLLIMLFWSLDILGYILSKSADWPYIVGLSIVVVYELTSLAVLEAIFPAAG